MLGSLGVTIELADDALSMLAGYGLETRTYSRGIRGIIEQVAERLVLDQVKGTHRLCQEELRGILSSMDGATAALTKRRDCSL